MAFSSEAIYSALFALTSGLAPGTFKTRSRVLKHFGEVPAESQPALYQAEISEECQQLSGTSPIWRFKCAWIVYTDRGESESVLPSQLQNSALDALRSALRPIGEPVQSLGGLCVYARETGVEISEGVLGQQAIAQMNIEILAPEDLNC